MENVVYNLGLFWSFWGVLHFHLSFLIKLGRYHSGGHKKKYLGPTNFHPIYILLQPNTLIFHFLYLFSFHSEITPTKQA